MFPPPTHPKPASGPPAQDCRTAPALTEFSCQVPGTGRPCPVLSTRPVHVPCAWVLGECQPAQSLYMLTPNISTPLYLSQVLQ